MPKARAALFLALGAAALLPGVGATLALAAGIAFSLVLGNPWPERTASFGQIFLKVSVVGLGFGLSLATVWRVGARSALFTAVGITLTMLLGWVLGRLAGTTGPESTLISFGTAICGGSAIAAMAPVVKAKSEEVAVALATVFTLNAVALVLFPPLGHALRLSQQAFGLWAGLAIHDTSSVVGAASAYGSEALAVGTTVKLTRALWIVPGVLVVALAKRTDARLRFPLFIAGFVLAAALRTLLPAATPVWDALFATARQCLVLTLFLVGAGLSRAALARVGVRPLLEGAVLWLLVGAGTLAAILAGLVSP